MFVLFQLAEYVYYSNVFSVLYIFFYLLKVITSVLSPKLFKETQKFSDKGGRDSLGFDSDLF